MLLIPAIDLKDGQCVQLRQGVMDSATVYSTDPAAMARHWVDAGARRLHVVDLDGAFAGRPVNHELVGRIAHAAGGVPVQVGGGVRDVETARAYLDVGVSQVITGTAAVEDPDFLTALCEAFPGRAVLGLDARDGRVATRGWATVNEVDAVAFAGALDVGLFAIVYTDVGRDGMLAGVNVAATKRIALAANVPVIASGGISSLDDLRALDDLGFGPERLLGAISGSALYEGKLDFASAQRWLAARRRTDAS
ncbi:MAG: 1-(5-phosphoribosyl)-5-[(5-phosphoribosylamino)methylideneamino]imidazole-4-carboxamide isomerase [Gammaproteobacteria bacterium]|nr:1-(5-phosphoribosyl)-5-[(5-phosphoribosylamino)methylideneamino]imidazole-4-carboxamide isomerase [Gammaproteobacteria bacterium]